MGVFGDDVIMNASVFVSMLNMNDSETFHRTLGCNRDFPTNERWRKSWLFSLYSGIDHSLNFIIFFYKIQKGLGIIQGTMMIKLTL